MTQFITLFARNNAPSLGSRTLARLKNYKPCDQTHVERSKKENCKITSSSYYWFGFRMLYRVRNDSVASQEEISTDVIVVVA